MLELVMVIVVLGILAAVAIPRMERDLRQEAADNLLSAIRFTQHLAVMDNKTNPKKSKWQQRYWHIYFGTCDGTKRFYAIGSDENMNDANNGRVDFDESAIDPANGKHVWAHDGATCNGSHALADISPNVFITKKYGIDTVTPSGGCTNSYIGFDHLGRPHVGFGDADLNSGYNTPMATDCTYTFTFEDGSTPLKITIAAETGFAQIVGQDGS